MGNRRCQFFPDAPRTVETNDGMIQREESSTARKANNKSLPTDQVLKSCWVANGGSAYDRKTGLYFASRAPRQPDVSFAVVVELMKHVKKHGKTKK